MHTIKNAVSGHVALKCEKYINSQVTTKALALTPEWALTWTVASVTWMRKLVYSYKALTCLKKRAWKGHLQFVL